MSNEITTSTKTDSEGCVIATATRGNLVCHYDGDDYSGNGSSDEDLRYKAKAAFADHE